MREPDRPRGELVVVSRTEAVRVGEVGETVAVVVDGIVATTRLELAQILRVHASWIVQVNEVVAVIVEAVAARAVEEAIRGWWRLRIHAPTPGEHPP
jgi:predicted aspartyl protease